MKDYLKEIYDWAYFNMEGCDKPEFSLFDGLCSVIVEYWQKNSLEFLNEHLIPEYDENIEF